MEVTPSRMVTEVTEDQLSYHGAWLELEYESILPLPEMIIFPPSYSVQFTPSPQVPLAVVAADTNV